jgi:hypothetical protein
MAPIGAGLAALASHIGAMSPAKLAAIPLAAGLAIGTAAGALYATTSASIAEPAAPQVASLAPASADGPAAAPVRVVPEIKSAAPVVTAKRGIPCNEQTWPYIDAKCRVGQADTDRKVRVVMAPRPGETPTEAQQSSDLARKENPSLVSSSTVLHTPQPIAAEPKVTTRSAKRQMRRHQERRRVAAQTYQVPSEYGRGNARIVVRPMQYDPYR